MADGSHDNADTLEPREKHTPLIEVPLVGYHKDRQYLIGKALIDPDLLKKASVEVPEGAELVQVTATNYTFKAPKGKK